MQKLPRSQGIKKRYIARESNIKYLQTQTENRH